VSPSRTISLLIWFFGAGKWTMSSFKTCKNSYHGIRDGFPNPTFEAIYTCLNLYLYHL
jgi:hypothetical protein